MPELIPTPVIPLSPVPSSQLAAIGHDPATRTLAVRFKGKPGTVGALYHYANVPAELYAEFIAAESPGAFFQQRIKPQVLEFPYRLVEQAGAKAQDGTP